MVHQRQGKLFYTISKQREVIYQTREGVFYLISKHREVMLYSKKWKRAGRNEFLHLFRGDKMSDERFFAVYYISS